MGATPGKWAENSAREIMAENSANVAQYSAREKEIIAENLANVAENSAREKENVTENSARLWPRFQLRWFALTLGTCL